MQAAGAGSTEGSHSNGRALPGIYAGSTRDASSPGGSSRTLFPVQPVKRRRSITSTESTPKAFSNGLTSWLRRENSAESARAAPPVSDTRHTPSNHDQDTSDRSETTSNESVLRGAGWSGRSNISDVAGPSKLPDWLEAIEEDERRMKAEQLEADRQLALQLQEQFKDEPVTPPPQPRLESMSPSSSHTSALEMPSVSNSKPAAGGAGNPSGDSTPVSKGQSLLSRWLDPIAKRLKV